MSKLWWIWKVRILHIHRDGMHLVIDYSLIPAAEESLQNTGPVAFGNPSASGTKRCTNQCENDSTIDAKTGDLTSLKDCLRLATIDNFQASLKLLLFSSGQDVLRG